MAACAQWTQLDAGNVQLTVLTEAPSGECTQLVVMTPVEYAAWLNNPLNLSIADGALISGAIAGVWAIAWGIKLIARAIDFDGD